ncbi:hypothetical protein Dimus_018907 [Dionaea muscipula]
MGKPVQKKRSDAYSCCKEFYANLAVFIYKKKEIAKSRVKGVEIEFDSMKSASITDVPGHTGISEYIKEVWEESSISSPLRSPRKFADNSSINVARRVQSTEMKPFQRFVHFVVMKNVVPRFGKRDLTSFMDLTYMDHLVSGRKINLPRVMMRHMAYVISVKDHELSYGDWMSMIFDAFGVPLVDKKGEERRAEEEEEEVEEEEKDQTDFDWEAVVDEAAVEGESGSDERFMMLEWMWKNRCETQLLRSGCSKLRFDEGNDSIGVDPSCPIWSNSEAMMNKLQG